MFSDLKRLEIELHSECNRSCFWCTNNYKKRSVEILPKNALLNLCRDLKELNFEKKLTVNDIKTITLNGYSEPMMHIDLLKDRVRGIRSVISKVDITINTNGDFLSIESLDGLLLDQISIMDYDSLGHQYWIEKLKSLKATIIKSTKDRIVAFNKDINKIVVKVNWPDNNLIEDRAGYLRNKNLSSNLFKNRQGKRTKPCFEPVFSPVINSNGNVMPCCEMRSDINKPYIMGNIKDDTFSNIWNYEKNIKLRNIFLSKKVEEYPKECLYCQKERLDPLYTDERFLISQHPTKENTIDKNKVYLNSIRRVK